MAVYKLVMTKLTIDHAVAHSVMYSVLLPLLTLVVPVVLDSSLPVPDSGGRSRGVLLLGAADLDNVLLSATLRQRMRGGEVGVEGACFFALPLFSFFLRLGPSPP